MNHRSDIKRWRVGFITGCILLMWLILAVRLVQVQGYSRDGFASRATRQRTFKETIPARPGEIVDRNGHVLALTVTRRSLFLDPSRIENRWEVAQGLASALNLNADRLYQQLSEKASRRFIWVKRRLSDGEVQRVRELNLPEETWGYRNEYQRSYPQGNLAAHALGIRNIDNEGSGGVEQSFDSAIRGTEGSRILVRDARGAVIDIRPDEAPRHGATIVTTIDSTLQVQVEKQLDEIVERWAPTGACAIVMQPATGDILAMASRPSFNPNEPAGQKDAWSNLCISAVYEPGSTIKPFIVGWAIDQGLLNANEIFDCENGAYRMGRRVLHDSHPYGRLSVNDVLVKSSNIGMAKIGERLTNEGLYRSLLTFGFVRRTGLELPGELSGLVRSLDKWNDYSIGSVPMGHEIAITPMQLITAHAALANGGRMVYPRLTTAESSPLPTPVDTISRDSAPAPIVAQTISPEIAHWLVTGPMREVVERGTAKRARIEGVSVFGKTGTAQKLTPDGPVGHVCSFVGGAPAENPGVLVLVVVDCPTGQGVHYGGTVAAPAAREILLGSLQKVAAMTRMTSKTQLRGSAQ
ncbi:MAG: peptidoglycan D,D-transpeptidase FtsI family protein [Planctomycetaceae bacterium]